MSEYLERSDMERWPMETRVVFDMLVGGRGDRALKVWTDAALDRAMRKANGEVHEFQLTSRFRFVAADGDFTEMTTQATRDDFLIAEDCELSEDFHMRQNFIPAPLPIARFGTTTILVRNPSEFQPGDWIQIGTERFAAGDLIGNARITEVDRLRGRITLAAEYAEMGLISASDVREVIAGGRIPAVLPRSRVPAHVQLNRPRLDGRRRR